MNISTDFNLLIIMLILIKLVSSNEETGLDVSDVPIFVLPLNACSSPGKTIYKLHATGNNLSYSIIGKY